MKKKQLKNLNSIHKWLSSKTEACDSLDSAFETIRNAINSLSDDEVKNLDTKLPNPSELNDPSMIALYSDGGCRGNPGPGAFAYLAQNYEGEILVEGVEFERMTTNNKMELGAVIGGLNELLEILPQTNKDPLLTGVKVITDSKYVVDGMTSWLSGWKSRGWKKADNKSPENLELWQELDQVSQKFMRVEWMWVKGHGGHPQNEYCDRRANEMMDENIIS
jgi:ribonuclease HI